MCTYISWSESECADGLSCQHGVCEKQKNGIFLPILIGTSCVCVVILAVVRYAQIRRRRRVKKKHEKVEEREELLYANQQEERAMASRLESWEQRCFGAAASDPAPPPPRDPIASMRAIPDSPAGNNEMNSFETVPQSPSPAAADRSNEMSYELRRRSVRADVAAAVRARQGRPDARARWRRASHVAASTRALNEIAQEAAAERRVGNILQFL